MATVTREREMTNEEASRYLRLNKPTSGYPGLCEAIDLALAALAAPPAEDATIDGKPCVFYEAGNGCSTHDNNPLEYIDGKLWCDVGRQFAVVRPMSEDPELRPAKQAAQAPPASDPPGLDEMIRRRDALIDRFKHFTKQLPRLGNVSDEVIAAENRLVELFLRELKFLTYPLPASPQAEMMPTEGGQ